MSLFDVAESVFEDSRLEETHSKSPKNESVPTLLLLDQVLEGIYQGREQNSTQMSSRPRKATVDRRIEQDNLRYRASETIMRKQRPPPMRRKTEQVTNIGTSNASKPRPPPPNADLIARNILRTIDGEIKKWENDPERVKPSQFVVYLRRQFIDDVLDPLQETAFVKLAKKKIGDKLAKLEAKRSHEDTTSIESYGNEIETALKDLRMVKEERDEQQDSKAEQLEVKKRQQTLNRLLELPPEAISKLPKAQQELVEHTRRYRQMLELKPEQIRALPLHHQQLVKHIRAKLNVPIS